MSTLYSLVYFFGSCLIAVIGSPTWNQESLQACPNVPAQKGVPLEQIIGDWRLAYLFLEKVDEGLEEDSTCIVTSITSNNDSQLELSIFIDNLRANHIDRSSVQFPADIITPSEWKVHTPLTFEGYLHARIIRASEEHLIITFCGPDQERVIDNEINGARPKSSDEEAGLDWRSLFESSKRRRRSTTNKNILNDFQKESHMWTAVLVKNNDVSAMKFVEYAAILMKHGYDVTQGELVSFGKCPLLQNHNGRRQI